tara:strand:+ start:358 stop:744 length:387 start_codon:yes stop_codon:yes gene_type:complete
MDEFIIQLPEVIKNKITSYLYFSDEVSNKIKIVNNMICYYDNYIFAEFKKVFVYRILTLYFRLTKFIKLNPSIYHKINHYMNPYLNSIYPDPNPKFDLQTLTHIEKVIKHMNIVQKQRAYNYIMFHKF